MKTLTKETKELGQWLEANKKNNDVTSEEWEAKFDEYREKCWRELR